MGFDVIYLPPIHPIGHDQPQGAATTPSPPAPTTSARRGRSARRTAATTPSTPTSARSRTSTPSWPRPPSVGLEVALDLALQAAPDHPWATEHPEFFTTRADGTIAYAENPPKKYQDIYPINFDNDPEGIYAEVLRVVRHWMDHGVRIFRVDNPHTKPVAFWERLLGEIRETDPDVIFLSEAFTRPAMMQALGMVGFHQSYTYFTWRTAACEIEEYFREVSRETSHVLRPNFFVNTPDILHEYLQYGGPPAFKIRAVLAALGSPSWGMYAGFELFEHVAVRPGSEEYLDSEKYQIRIRDWDARRGRGTVAGAVRHDAQPRPPGAPGAPAAAQPDGAQRRGRLDRGVLQDRRTAPTAADDTVIAVVNVDPHSTRETTVHLDLPAHRAGLGRPVRRARRGHRRGLDLGRPQLRPSRPLPRARAHPDREEHPPLMTPMTRTTRDDDPHRARHDGTPPGRPPAGAADDWFKTAVFYEVLVRSFRDSDGDGIGDFKGLTEKLDYLQWLGRRLPLGAAVLHLAAARRRLRRRRLHRGPARGRHDRGLPRVPRRGAQARHPRDHRLRHEPHQRPAPVVPGVPERPRRPLRRLLRLVRHTTTSTRRRGSSSSTPSRRTGPGTRSASSTSGTASTATSRT